MSIELSAIEYIQTSLRMLNEALPDHLPDDWKEFELPGPRILRAFYSRRRLQVRASAEAMKNDASDWWLHVSLSYQNRMPSYADMTAVKRVFIGRERKAVMVLPADSRKDNLHQFCLHLYSPLEHDPLPDFEEARMPE